MSKEGNYKMAVALLRFKSAYHELVAASKELPDLDVSQNYPFYILDYEEIENAVMQWCTVQADKLMKDLPDKVDNPACIKCQYFGKGLGPGGQCKGHESIDCKLYPFITFSREMAIPVLTGIDVTEMNDNTVQLLYLRRIEECKGAKK